MYMVLMAVHKGFFYLWQEKEQLEQEIDSLNTERRHLEFHIERTGDLFIQSIFYWWMIYLLFIFMFTKIGFGPPKYIFIDISFGKSENLSYKGKHCTAVMHPLYILVCELVRSNYKMFWQQT